MEQSEKQTEKHTERSSRVVDVSWAADYLDDAWEHEHSAKGAYDTQVIPPLKKYLQAETAAVDSRSSTQQFRTLEEKNTSEDNEDDDIRIVDALTDQTIASGELAREVRSAASLAKPLEQEGQDKDTEEEDLKIRDAVTDQTVASVEEARAVRKAAAFFDLKKDWDSPGGIRDALSGVSRMPAFSGSKQPPADERPSAVAPSRLETASSARYTAGPGQRISGFEQKPPAYERPFASASSRPEPVSSGRYTEKPEEIPEPDKTIVASKEVVDHIRKAASGTGNAARVNLEELFREDDIDLEPEEDDLYDQYEDIDPYEDADDYQSPSHFDDPREPEPFYDTPDPEEAYEGRRKRHHDAYYYGYRQSRSPLRFIPLVLVLAICVLGFIAALQICHDVPLNASDYSKIKYTVEPGLTDEKLSQDLEALGIIDNTLVFKLRCLFYSADYVPGTYELSPCYSTEKIINILSGYIYGSD